ncbi:hypothetical protein KFK09_005731 [Dendrobium nobile]|uniref:Uncharacterized protein n=1 Tax=Dendrobium nobile TaxID=94219 RepID=A0A8T3C252_DENNO|nr:hypothetical protein KFK09_005731 [Dendrobium nobile]
MDATIVLRRLAKDGKRNQTPAESPEICGLRKFGPGLRSLFLFGEGVLTE